MSKYEAVHFVGDNKAINRVGVGSFKTRNRGAFSGSLAALILDSIWNIECMKLCNYIYQYYTINNLIRAGTGAKKTAPSTRPLTTGPNSSSREI